MSGVRGAGDAQKRALALAQRLVDSDDAADRDEAVRRMESAVDGAHAEAIDALCS